MFQVAIDNAMCGLPWRGCVGSGAARAFRHRGFFCAWPLDLQPILTVLEAAR
jgi:hypothetical protein